MATDLTLGRWIPFGRAVTDRDWDALYREQLPRIYNFFRYRVGEVAVAEDLTSLTFEKAWQARDRYDRDRSAFGTWLLAVARNVAVDHYRASKVRRTVPLEAVEGMSGGPTPEEITVRRSDAERLAELLSGLPEDERELLALKYGAGLKNREIAKVTGLSESNVGTRAHRIVMRLREAWGE